MCRTLWSIFSWNLDRVFAIFYIKNKWDKRPNQKKVKSQEYMKLICRYEVILNRKSDIAGKINNMELVELMVELLEVIMIQRMSKSR